MNIAHWHLILNHLPVLGTLFGLAALAAGLWKSSEDLKRFALVAFAGSALAALAVYFTGEPAEDAVKHLSGVASGALEQHEDAAGAALGGVLALGALALTGLIVFRRERPIAKWLAATSLIGALIVAGLMSWTANLGGQIRHSEIHAAGSVVAPVHHEAGEGK